MHEQITPAGALAPNLSANTSETDHTDALLRAVGDVDEKWRAVVASFGALAVVTGSDAVRGFCFDQCGQILGVKLSLLRGHVQTELDERARATAQEVQK